MKKHSKGRLAEVGTKVDVVDVVTELIADVDMDIDQAEETLRYLRERFARLKLIMRVLKAPTRNKAAS